MYVSGILVSEYLDGISLLHTYYTLNLELKEQRRFFSVYGMLSVY